MFPLECHKFHPDFPSFLAKNFVRDVQDYENAKFFLLFHVQIMSRKWEKFYRSNFVWSKVFSPINSLILKKTKWSNIQWIKFICIQNFHGNISDVCGTYTYFLFSWIYDLDYDWLWKMMTYITFDDVILLREIQFSQTYGNMNTEA